MTLLNDSLSDAQLLRYSRHLLLDELGIVQDSGDLLASIDGSARQPDYWSHLG